MNITNEFDSLIEDIQFLETVEGFPGVDELIDFQDLRLSNYYLADPANPTPNPPPGSTGDGFPGFNFLDLVIPKELNIDLSALNWVLCDNGIGEILDFLGGLIKAFVGGISTMFKALMDLIKFLVGLLQGGWPDLLGLLKYTLRMMKDFYCTSQHIRFVTTKAAPVLRPGFGLDPIDPKTPKPPVPSVYGSTTTEGRTDSTSAQQIFDALLLLQQSLVDRVGANLVQLQQNENARYEDLRSQLISLIPPEYKDQVSSDATTDIQKAIEKAKAEKEKYLDDLDASISDINVQIAKISENTSAPTSPGGNSGGAGTSGGDNSTDHGTGTGPGGSDGVTVTPSTGITPGPIGSDGVTVTPSTGVHLLEDSQYLLLRGLAHPEFAIADLPPLDPFISTVTEIKPDPTGTTYKNCLDLVNLITQKGAIETSNNLLIVGTNNRAMYKSERAIIDAVRDTIQKQRLQEQKDRDAAQAKNDKKTLIYRYF